MFYDFFLTQYSVLSLVQYHLSFLFLDIIVQKVINFVLNFLLLNCLCFFGVYISDFVSYDGGFLLK